MASRATIRDRVKYLPPTRISGIGETSGFDPATMKDQLIWSPRWPLLASAPATVVNGQRFRLADASREFGREYLGRSVVHLNSGDDTVIYPLPSTVGPGFAVEMTYRDLNAIFGADILYCLHDGTLEPTGRFLQITYTDDYLTGHYRNSDGVQISFDPVSITGNVFNMVRLEIGEGFAKLSCGGNSSTITVDISKQMAYAQAGTYYFSTEDRPFQLCCFKQHVAGTLIDHIPCTETTGTVLANLATPSRPATLSDANAHALAWVPQDDVTMGMWMSNGVEWAIIP